MSEKGLSTCDPRAKMGIGDGVESKWNEQIEFGKGESLGYLRRDALGWTAKVFF